MAKVLSLVPIYASDPENGITNTYLVRLNEDCNREAHMNWMRGQEIKYVKKEDVCEIRYEYRYLKGYEAMLSGSALHDLTNRQDVKSIVQDCKIMCPDPPTAEVPLIIDKPLRTGEDLIPIFTIASQSVGITIQSDAPWGLARLSEVSKLGSGPYEYQYTLVGDPPQVDVYVLDSGIKLDHTEFGGRARFGRNFTLPDRNMDDGDAIGHGTHVAGTIGGNSVGVAKHVNIISVKVLSSEEGTARVVEAIDWVLEQVEVSGNPSIINISLVSGQPRGDIDSNLSLAVARGVHVVAAAGNDNRDAGDLIPPRVQGILTVGASTIQDERWVSPRNSKWGSNFGACVGIFAPGVDIMSAAIYDKNRKPSTTALRLGTGTSMAAPHVTGLIACLIETGGNRPPAQMIANIQAAALPVVTNVPNGTVNLLAHMHAATQTVEQD